MNMKETLKEIFSHHYSCDHWEHHRRCPDGGRHVLDHLSATQLDGKTDAGRTNGSGNESEETCLSGGRAPQAVSEDSILAPYSWGHLLDGDAGGVEKIWKPQAGIAELA